MAKVAVSINDPLFVPHPSDGVIEIKRFGDVVKMLTLADGHSIQVALSTSDALALAMQLIDAARVIHEG
jgi:hypothetical protein